MTDLVVVGTIIALAGIIVYITRGWEKTKIEKAALENSKAASDAKIELLIDQQLKTESALRDKENDVPEDDLERTDVRFYPERLRPDKDDLN
jgi:cytochrome oxidase assembly protein ShyY1